MSRRPELKEFVERVRHLPHQTELDAAAVEVLDAFEAAGVESLLLKGPALAQMLYHPGEHRGYGDIDLLVAPTDLDAGRRALAELGYANSERGGLDDVAGIMHSELWSQALESKMVQLMVDLHWRLAGCEAPADVIWKVLGRRRAGIELGGRSVPILAHDGLALHLATHAAQHGPDDIKAIADLVRGLERWDPEIWRSAADLAEQVDGAAAFAAGLRLTAPGTELAREIGSPPTDDLTWAILNRDTRPRGTFHVQALAGARGVRERLDVLRRSLFPRPEWITWEYQWSRGAGRARLVAAYAIHLLRAPAWAVRAWRYRRAARRRR